MKKNLKSKFQLKLQICTIKNMNTRMYIIVVWNIGPESADSNVIHDSVTIYILIQKI